MAGDAKDDGWLCLLTQSSCRTVVASRVDRRRLRVSVFKGYRIDGKAP
jgi:hypothetical protein